MRPKLGHGDTEEMSHFQFIALCRMHNLERRMELILLILSVTVLFFEAKGQTYPDDFPCKDSTWTYHPYAGKCYKLASTSRLYTPADAKSTCKAIMKEYPTVKVNVAEIRTTEELEALKSYLIRHSLKEKINLSARRTGSQNPFVWESDKKEVDFSFLPWIGNSRTDDCLVMYYDNIRIGKTWSTMAFIDANSCTSSYATVCEHKIKRCENPSGGFDAAKMEFIPTEPYPGTSTEVVCKTGYFQRPSSNTTRYASKFKCVGKRDETNAADPSKYTTSLIYNGGDLRPCDSVTCELDTKSICHAKPSSVDYPNNATFNYGKNVTLECDNGYGYALDLSKKTATMQCLTVPEAPNLGIWFPGPCQVCGAIRCNETQMINMIPDHASLTGARSIFTEEEYGPLQISQFNQYGHIVTYSCDESYFFTDRSFQKHIKCTLKSGSTNEGEWVGYGGTSLPLPKACQPVKCKYEDILVKSTYNIQPNFTIEFPNGTVEHQFKLHPVLYPYLTKIQYLCKIGYETVTKFDDQNITCDLTGRWKPQLAGCIKKEEPMQISSGGRYIPPTIEAPSAKKLGLAMIFIIFVFFLTLMLLDLATIRRDIGWFFNNIHLQKRLWAAKRRFREMKRAVKAKTELE